eukprot:COSAG06_NODE_11154_length_1558_cov_1.625000_1_plen_127_part_00
MHPVEHLFYFSCFALAFLVPYHPCHLLLNKYHTDLSALGTPHARTGGQNSCSDIMIRLFVVLIGCSYKMRVLIVVRLFFGQAGTTDTVRRCGHTHTNSQLPAVYYFSAFRDKLRPAVIRPSRLVRH